MDITNIYITVGAFLPEFVMIVVATSLLVILPVSFIKNDIR